MAFETYANNAITTLNGALTSGATTFTVASAAGFSAAATGVSQFHIAIDTELMLVTNVSGTTFTVTRAQEGTTAAAHASGAGVYEVLTVASLANGYVSLRGNQSLTGGLTLGGNSTVDGNLTIANSGSLIIGTSTLINSSGSLFYPDGEILVDTSPKLYYPYASEGLADDTGTLYYSTGTALADATGTLYLSGGVLDSMASLGTMNQALTSTGTGGVVWNGPYLPLVASGAFPLTNQLVGTTFNFSSNRITTGTQANYVVAPFNNSSGVSVLLGLDTTYSTSSTGGWTVLQVNATQSSDTGSGVKDLIDLQLGGVSKFQVSSGGAVTMAGGLVSIGNLQGSAVLVSSTGFGIAQSSAGRPLAIGNTNQTTAIANVNISGGTVTSSSGTYVACQIIPVYNQTSTAAATDLVINRTETAVGSGAQKFISCQVAASEKLGVDNKGVVYPNTPQTTVAGGTSGSIVASMPFAGASFKKVLVWLNALLGAAVYTFPTAFTNAPTAINTLGLTVTTTQTTVTITGATTTGFISLEGY